MISVWHKLDTSFSVKCFRNGEPTDVRFGELLSRRTVVSVYMRNNTPSCDRQNDQLSAFASECDRAGLNLVAISRDTCGSHARYAAAKKISYVLVSDPDDRFARATDSVVEKSMYGRTFSGPARAAYVLDADGTVLAIVEKVDPKNHAAQLRAAIASVGAL
jgi:peroxiredoxin Q/BCP